MTTGVRDLGFPPSIVLQANDGQDIALCEAEFLGDGSTVAVQGASLKLNMLARGLQSRELSQLTKVQDWTTITAELPAGVSNSDSAASRAADRRTATITIV